MASTTETQRRKAITTFADRPTGQVVRVGTTWPADDDLVVRHPDLFTSPDRSDADLPALYGAHMIERERVERKERAITPGNTAVALGDFRWQSPTAEGNRFTQVRKGQRVARNAPIARWNPGRFKPLEELEKAGRIGRHGELLPPSSPLVETTGGLRLGHVGGPRVER